MNSNSSQRSEWLIASLLLLTLIVTRSGHFGSAFKLPDASWAMFWLCGALTARWWWPALLMMAAALVDYFVISHGVSSYCVTPAYPFLIPAYLALWFAGRWVCNSLHADVHAAIKVLLSIATGVTLAFIISNAGFYAFAGYFPTLSVWQYTQDVMQYWPHYFTCTTAYAITGILIRFIIRAAYEARASYQASP